MFFSERTDFQHDILLGPLVGHFLVHFGKLVSQFYILSSLVNSILQGESGKESASQPASQDVFLQQHFMLFYKAAKMGIILLQFSHQIAVLMPGVLAIFKSRDL